MRRKIWRMSEDRFDPAPGSIQLETEALDLTAVEKEPFSGAFSFSSADGALLRGMVFSSNPYVEVENPAFEGTSVTVRFSVIHAGCRAGDVLSGDFYVILQGKSFDIPYSITYVPQSLMVDGIAIEKPEDFAALYRKAPADAMALFYTDDFASFAVRAGKDFELLYRGYRLFPRTYENLEEFLTGAGLKDRVHFDISETSLTYTVGEEAMRESIDITKSAWGYCRIEVSCDSLFITVGHTSLSNDFFVGSVCHFDFFIHPERMHAGKNYCRITFTGTNDVKSLTVLCRKEEGRADRDDSRRVRLRGSVALTEAYLSYRFGRLTAEKWCEKSLSVLDTMETVSDANERRLLSLMRTQALIVTGRKAEALPLVESLKTDIVDRKSFEWAYLLYLCTMIEPEKTYVDRLTAEVENIFRDRQGDERVFWLLLFLREEYVTNGLKELTDIRQFVMAGSSSPFLYVEALSVIKKDPLLIKEFDAFTIRILSWAARKGRLTGNISMRLSTLLGREKAYDPRVFYIVKKAYATSPSQELLDAALRYLLRNSVYGPDVLSWYDLAVRSGLSLTGLYEAYVMSLPEDYARPLPEDVLRYFGYSNTISFDRKAFVYASMITNRAANPIVYEETKKTVETFALEMMRHRRLDENLAVIYQDVLDRGIIDADVAGMMASFLVPVKISCSIQNVRRAVIVTDAADEPVYVPVIRDTAYIPVSCRTYRVFLEMDGGLYISEKGFILVRDLMDLTRCLPRLKKESRDLLPYFIYDLNYVKSEEDIPKDMADTIAAFLDSPDIRYGYKAGRFSLFIRYLRTAMREDVFERYLLRESDYSGMDSRTISFIIDLFVIGKNSEAAYRLLRNYYGIKATGRSLLSLVTEKIEEEPDRADDFLVSLSAYLMSQYLDNETTIRYLGQFYVGPEQVMADIWKHMKAYSLSADGLSERAVTEMLYTENFSVDSEDVFEDYLSGHPNRMIAEAWFTYWAHSYMRHGNGIPVSVFTHLAELYRRGEKLNESCLVGLLARLCRKDSLSEEEHTLLSDLLSEAIRKNLYFDFYRECPDDLLIRYHLYDKYFVTYEGEEGQRIDLFLKNGAGQKIRAEMVEMYPGIYVSEFVLFFGDKSDYEICLRDEPEQVLKTGEISCTDEFPGGEGSRYGLINRMRSGLIYSDDRQTISDMKKYTALTNAVEKLFSLR